jgi:hypothetical protein
MEVIVVPHATGDAADRAPHRRVVEENATHPWMLIEQSNQLDRGSKVVVRPIQIGAARGVSRQLVLAYWPAVNLNAALMRLVLIVRAAAGDADVANPEFAIAYRLPLALDLKNDGEQVGVCELCLRASAWNVADIPVHVIPCALWRLWQHEIAAPVLRLEDSHIASYEQELIIVELALT